MKWPLASVLFAAAPAWASEAAAATDSLGHGALLRLTGGLLLVLALVFAAAWTVRRIGRLPLAGSGSLRLLGGVAVGQRERVVLIEAGGERLLLGVAPGRVAMLHALPPAAAQDHADQESLHAAHADTAHDPAAPPPGAAFHQRLGALLRRGGVR